MKIPPSDVTSSASAEEPKQLVKPKRRGVKGVGVALAGVLLFGGGFWFGKVTTDPTASEDYAALDATGQSAASNRDAYRTRWPHWKQKCRKRTTPSYSVKLR